MKVKELIEALKKMDQNLEVYGYCNHGQSPEKVSAPQVIYTDSVNHNLWDEWVSDSEEAVDYSYTVMAVML